MFSFIAGIFSWIVSSTVGNFVKTNGIPIIEQILGIVDKNVSDANKAEELKNQLLEKYLDAQVASSAIRKDAFGPWAWFMAALFLPGPVLWWNMVFFDSVFNWTSYNVLALPSEFYPWMTSIIGALFFIPTIQNLTTKK